MSCHIHPLVVIWELHKDPWRLPTCCWAVVSDREIFNTKNIWRHWATPHLSISHLGPLSENLLLFCVQLCFISCCVLLAKCGDEVAVRSGTERPPVTNQSCSLNSNYFTTPDYKAASCVVWTAQRHADSENPQFESSCVWNKIFVIHVAIFCVIALTWASCISFHGFIISQGESSEPCPDLFLSQTLKSASDLYPQYLATSELHKWSFMRWKTLHRTYHKSSFFKNPDRQKSRLRQKSNTRASS